MWGPLLAAVLEALIAALMPALMEMLKKLLEKLGENQKAQELMIGAIHDPNAFASAYAQALDLAAGDLANAGEDKAKLERLKTVLKRPFFVRLVFNKMRDLNVE